MAVSWHNGCQHLLIRALRVCNKPMPDLRVAELGDQRVKMLRKHVATLKTFFEFFGSYHVSIDLNGWGKALTLDLNEPIADHTLRAAFDMVTNFGTTEHVTNQLSVFRNVHWLCRPGGLMVHAVPMPGVAHGSYQYSPEWFAALAERQHYAIVHLEPYRTAPHEEPGYVNALLVRASLSDFDEESWEAPVSA